MAQILKYSRLAIVSCLALTGILRAEGEIYYFNGQASSTPPQISQNTTIYDRTLYSQSGAQPAAMDAQGRVMPVTASNSNSMMGAEWPAFQPEPQKDLSSFAQGWDLSAGYSSEWANFNFVSQGGSKLSWTAMQFNNLDVALRKDLMVVGQNFFLFGDFRYGTTGSAGASYDDDLSTVDTQIISRGDSSATQWLLNLGAGWANAIKFTPHSALDFKLGYTSYNTDLKMSNQQYPQTYCVDGGGNLIPCVLTTGAIAGVSNGLFLPGLTQHYTVQYDGLQLGVNWHYKIAPRAMVIIDEEVGYLAYSADGVWPYRGPLFDLSSQALAQNPSFRDQGGLGTSYSSRLTITYKQYLSNQWLLSVHAGLNNYWTRNANSTYFFANGSQQQIPDGLVHASWQSVELGAKLHYSF